MATGVQDGAATQCPGLPAPGSGGHQPNATERIDYEPSSLIRTGTTTGGRSMLRWSPPVCSKRCRVFGVCRDALTCPVWSWPFVRASDASVLKGQWRTSPSNPWLKSIENRSFARIDPGAPIQDKPRGGNVLPLVTSIRHAKDQLQRLRTGGKPDLPSYLFQFISQNPLQRIRHFLTRSEVYAHDSARLQPVSEENVNVIRV